MTRDEILRAIKRLRQSPASAPPIEHLETCILSLLAERDSLAAQVETLRAEQSKLWKEGWLKGLSQCGIRSDPERAWRDREEEREERELQAARSAAPLPSTARDSWEPKGLRILAKRGRCEWHDTVLVERLPEYPGTFYCVPCADELRAAPLPSTGETPQT